MPKPYDATTKWLIDLHPRDWLSLLGWQPDVVEWVELLDVSVLDTDLSTVTASADRVLKIRHPVEALIHIELETGHHGSDKPGDLLRYSVLLTRKYKLPVETAVILLRREADSPALTGRLEYRRPSGDGAAYLHFEYTVIRIWELSAEALLSGGLGTLPLVPLAQTGSTPLPSLIRRIGERIASESGANAGELWTATKVLMGLRYSPEVTETLLKGVREMRESSTYQAILEEGRIEGEARGRIEGEARGRIEGEARGRLIEAQNLLFRLGVKRLGDPSEAAQLLIDSISSIEEVERRIEHVMEVESWGELLTDLL